MEMTMSVGFFWLALFAAFVGGLLLQASIMRDRVRDAENDAAILRESYADVLIRMNGYRSAVDKMRARLESRATDAARIGE